MRFFGGMTAEVTGLVVSDIRKHLRVVAQAWLRSELDRTGGDSASMQGAAL